jgi:hypothetical protein
MADKEEYILCAAIWYKDFPTSVFKPGNISKGVVLCGHRHTDIIHQHVSLMQKRQAEMGKYVQGFLTNTNKFLNRSEAMKVAIAANQLLEGSRFKEEGNELYSEDLY